MRQRKQDRGLNIDITNSAYRVFLRDVTAAMLVSLNNGTVAMLVSPTNPPGIELYCHANVFFCSGGKSKVTDHVSENTLH